MTPFSTFEREIRDQLGRTLGGGGFDPAVDITAITVNRWPHGYAPEWNPLWTEPLPEAELPNVIGRARFGRIAIANSDAGAAAYTSIWPSIRRTEPWVNPGQSRRLQKQKLAFPRD